MQALNVFQGDLLFQPLLNLAVSTRALGEAISLRTGHVAPFLDGEYLSIETTANRSLISIPTGSLTYLIRKKIPKQVALGLRPIDECQLKERVSAPEWVDTVATAFALHGYAQLRSAILHSFGSNLDNWPQDCLWARAARNAAAHEGKPFQSPRHASVIFSNTRYCWADQEAGMLFSEYFSLGDLVLGFIKVQRDLSIK